MQALLLLYTLRCRTPRQHRHGVCRPLHCSACCCFNSPRTKRKLGERKESAKNRCHNTKRKKTPENKLETPAEQANLLLSPAALSKPETSQTEKRTNFFLFFQMESILCRRTFERQLVVFVVLLPPAIVADEPVSVPQPQRGTLLSLGIFLYTALSSDGDTSECKYIRWTVALLAVVLHFQVVSGPPASCGPHP